MKKIKLALLTLPLLLACSSSNSNSIDTGWVNVNQNEAIAIYRNDTQVMYRAKDNSFDEIRYRYLLNGIHLKYNYKSTPYQVDFYGSSYSLVHYYNITY